MHAIPHPKTRMHVLVAMLVATVLASPAMAQPVETGTTNVLGNSIPGFTAVTVALGYIDFSGVETVVAISPPPPINVPPWVRLTIATGYDEAAIQSVKWTKDGVVLSSTSNTLFIANAAPSDSGYYRALVTIGGTVKPTDNRLIRVSSPPNQQLLNLSSRATITPASPTLIGGFVVAPGPRPLSERKFLLLRAVGPSLASVGVARPLAAPVLRVYRADGTEFPQSSLRPSLSNYAHIVGAFPLTAGAGDVSVVALFPSGVYSVHVFSADGGTGDVLLEIYELPENAWPPGVPVPL